MAGSTPPAASAVWSTRRSAGALAKGWAGAWKQALRLVSRDHVLSLADQAVVSGSGFLTTVLIARWSGAGELGVYAVAASLLGTLLTCQDSLILEPYLIQRHYPHGTPAERAGASLALSVLFSVGIMAALTIGALACLEWGAGREMMVMTWAIAGVVPFALTRQFSRRFAFARLAFGNALLLDSVVAAIQLAALGWLGASGRVSALSVFGALGVAYAAAAGGWLYWARGEFSVRARHVRTVLEQSWALGKWLLAGQVMVQVQGNIASWLALAVAGAAVAGVFAACMSVVAFANPVLAGLGNSFMPRSVLAWKSGGGPGLWREAVRNAALIAAAMTPFSLAVLIAGERVMQVLYPGVEYAGRSHTLTVLALATFAGAAGWPASIALATMERPRAIVAVSTVGAAVAVIFVWVLMTQWGLTGAAYGLLVGNVTGAVGSWAAFSLLLRRRARCEREQERKDFEPVAQPEQ
jgi:O-antigen/teichoic acid export membrane protein